ncbi:hypothetical protein DFH06DRAFT_1159445 [Mycena polygramma]|nr:hypothetical protein DFH06DRAFT_1159445 [Mycena polygramma]
MAASKCTQCGTILVTDVALDFNIAPNPESKHHKLLNSNQPPEDSETSSIKAVISQTVVTLTRVDDEISRLRERLGQLETERYQLEHCVLQHRAILSPLRRLPAEVLGEIFSWTLPVACERYSIAQSPWVLTHASQHWRDVAIGTPALWSLVDISYKQAYDPRLLCPLPMLETQISRANTLKIHFTGDEGVDPQPQTETFRCLAAHASRWGELTVDLTSAVFPILTGLRNRLPALRKLWIQWNCRESQEGVDLIETFETAPSLVDVTVFNDYRFIHILLPVHRLTSYQFDAPWTAHRAFLRVARNLVEARILVQFDNDTGPDDSEEIVDIPTLRRLHVSATKYCDYFRLHALEALSSDVKREEPLRHLMSLIERSSCTPTTLCLAGAPSAHRTAEILAKFPSIIDLRLVSHTNDPDDRRNFISIMSHFTPGLGASLIAPELQYMTFGCENEDYRNEDYMDYEVATRLLETRWGLDPNSPTHSALNSLRHQGLRLWLLSGTEGSDFMASWNIADYGA